MSEQTEIARGFIPAAAFTQLAEYHYRTYFLRLPENMTVDYLIDHPEAWTHATKRLRRYDLVRVVSFDDTVDEMLRVLAVKSPGGVHVERWPAQPKAEKVKGVKRYKAFQIRMINGQQCPRIEQMRDGKSRVIGFDNKQFGPMYETLSFATDAMAKFLADMGYDPKVLDEVVGAGDKAA